MTGPQRIRIACLVAISAFLYYRAVVLGAHVFLSPPPAWWLPGQEQEATVSIYLWLQVTHAAGLLLVSAPFAIAITLLRPTHPVRLALAVAVMALVLPSLYFQLTTSAWLPRPGTPSMVSATIDYLKFLITLPIMTWASARILARNRSFKPEPFRGSA